jgi:hypothetical protein
MKIMQRRLMAGVLALLATGLSPGAATSEDVDYECITVTITTTRTVTFVDGRIIVMTTGSSVTQCPPI